MMKRLFIIASVALFSLCVSADDSYDLLLKNFCDKAKCDGVGSSAYNELFDHTDSTLKPLCLLRLQENHCDQFVNEMRGSNLEFISCSTNFSMCRSIDSFATTAFLNCTVPVIGKTFKAFKDMALFPLSLASMMSMVSSSFKEDSKCYYDIERKTAPVFLFNSFAPSQFKIADSYIKRDPVTGSLTGPMTEWSCLEVNNLVYQKSRALHDFLADPKNAKVTQGRDYFKLQGDGLIAHYMDKLACLTAESRARYICDQLTTLAGNIIAGKIVTNFLTHSDNLFLGNSKGKLKIIDERKTNYTFDNFDNLPQKTVKPVVIYKYELANNERFTVVIPENGVGIQPHWLVKKRVQAALEKMPENLLAPVRQVVVNPVVSKTVVQGGVGYAESLDINITQAGMITPLEGTLAHELGHVLTENIKIDSPMVPKNWGKIKKADGTRVSLYGETHLAEDFAEAVRVYVQTDGGTKNVAKLEKFRGRFKEIDSLLDIPVAKRAEIAQIWKERLLKQNIQIFKIETGLGIFQNNTLVIRDEDTQKKSK